MARLQPSLNGVEEFFAFWVRDGMAVFFLVESPRAFLREKAAQVFSSIPFFSTDRLASWSEFLFSFAIFFGDSKAVFDPKSTESGGICYFLPLDSRLFSPGRLACSVLYTSLTGFLVW